jgi:hypothetical protein
VTIKNNKLSKNLCLHTPLALGPSNNHNTNIIADTGSSGHFFQSTTPLQNLRMATNPIPVTMPNGAIIYSTHTSELPIDDLPLAA